MPSCKFADEPNEPAPVSYFQNMYASTKPGLDHYWREQSYDQINTAGSSAAGWFSLPHARAHYVGPPLRLGQLANDCAAAAGSTVNLANLEGVNLVFNAEIGGAAWGGGHCFTVNNTLKCLSTTWLPPWGWRDITVIAHEMGHGFGLPHSSGRYSGT